MKLSLTFPKGKARDQWPIIVGGFHRSGTSLVRRMLNAHSHIYCGPEVKFLRDFYGDYAQDPLKHLRFFSSARSMLPEADLLRITGRAFVELHECAAAQAGKPRWADKNPENVIYLADWERLLGGDWLFVQIVREPRDTLASIKDIRFPLTIPEGLQDRIELYKRYTLAGLEFGATHSQRYYRLRYEELVRSPERVLGDLMKFLGERAEPGQLAFNSKPQQCGLEDPKIAATSRVHDDSVGKWKTILTPEEAELIERETAWLWARIAPDRSTSGV